MAERNAVKLLSNDESFIIKEADKGGAVVIMDREHYKTMAETLLLDEEYYQELSADPQKSDKIKFSQILRHFYFFLLWIYKFLFCFFYAPPPKKWRGIMLYPLKF